MREAGRGDIYFELPRPEGGTIFRVFFLSYFLFFLFNGDGDGVDGRGRGGNVTLWTCRHILRNNDREVLRYFEGYRCFCLSCFGEGGESSEYCAE